MTRAEILDCLTDRPCDSCKFHESGRCERWDCVFEEKPDDCTDTISRQAVIDTLDTSDKFMDEERTVETYKALLKECYEVLPSVTPKQKMGRLIKVVTEADYLGNETYHYECSECGFKSFFGTERYCQNCGAKMQEVDE